MSNEDHFEFKETDFKYNERFLRNLYDLRKDFG
jgi:hypothetical protein